MTAKLVRDLIPERMRDSGRACKVKTLNDEEFREALKAKLLEEAKEVATATSHVSLIEECADLIEVLEAVCSAYMITFEDVLARKANKNSQLGGFTRRQHIEL